MAGVDEYEVGEEVGGAREGVGGQECRLAEAVAKKYAIHEAERGKATWTVGL